MQKLSDYIKIVPNVLTDKQIEFILSKLKPSDLWEPAKISKDGKSFFEIRNCDVIGISINDSMKELDYIIFDAAKFAYCSYGHPLTIEHDTGYDALRYKEGGFYKTHVDESSKQNRTLSCSFALNDDYEGGDWGFWGDEIKFKAPKGSAVLFPSNFMFPHQIMEVTKGIRYSIVTWFV